MNTARTPAATRRLGHQPALDGLRGVAVILVLLFHSMWLGLSLPGGFLGVDLFFVLSGFLITTLLLERSHEPLWLFYRRRLLRLTPAVACLLGVTIAVTSVAAPDRISMTATSSTLIATYVFNWAAAFGVEVVDYLRHAWSLAVEEQFYILWPVVLTAGLRRFDRRTAGFAVLAVALGVAVWRSVLFHLDLAGWEALYLRTDTRADALLIGSAAAILRPWVPRIPSLLATASLALLLVGSGVLAQDDAFLYYGGLTLIALLGCIVTIAAVEPDWSLRRVLEWRRLRAVGTLSYSLYLWHYPIFVLAGKVALPVAVRIVVVFPLAFAAAWASHRYVEQPFLRLKTRLDERARHVPATRGVAEAATV